MELLSKFKIVLQGHYHSGGKQGERIHIAGSTNRLSFKDPGLSRNNILIYDTETGKVERESFTAPDWLVFNDDNIDDLLDLDNSNYVKVEVSTDLLLEGEVNKKLNQMKGKDVSIDLVRLSTKNRQDEKIELESSEDEISIIKRFIDKSELGETDKKALLDEAVRLVAAV